MQTIRQRPNLHLYGSDVLFAELADVLTRASLRKQLGVIGKQASEVLQDYAAAMQLIQAEPLAQPVCRDPDDDAVLALARGAQADLIVSGDQDLLVLGQFEGVPIITPREALTRIAQA